MEDLIYIKVALVTLVIIGLLGLLHRPKDSFLDTLKKMKHHEIIKHMIDGIHNFKDIGLDEISTSTFGAVVNNKLVACPASIIISRISGNKFTPSNIRTLESRMAISGLTDESHQQLLEMSFNSLRIGNIYNYLFYLEGMFDSHKYKMGGLSLKSSTDLMDAYHEYPFKVLPIHGESSDTIHLSASLEWWENFHKYLEEKDI